MLACRIVIQPTADHGLPSLSPFGVPRYKPGTTIGRWILEEHLGFGGNAEVWRASCPGGEVAVKILTKQKETARARFSDEIAIMRSAAVAGVVPILDFDIPAVPSLDPAWYAMPLGKRLSRALESAALSVITDAFASLASTLSVLNARQVFHRDLKPDNLLLIDGLPSIGDFGLVDFPQKDDRTGTREALGPRWTMAPEVRRDSAKASSEAAEVYALAKSFWIICMKQPSGFEGQYLPDDVVGLKRRWSEDYLTPLDALLAEATSQQPSSRPSLKEFAARLREWKTLSSDFLTYNGPEWQELLIRVVGAVRPSRSEWSAPQDIVLVLRAIAEHSGACHVFLAQGGGIEITNASLSSREIGCIELYWDSLPYIMQPKRLVFESCGGDSEWDYFFLETVPLAPSGVYDERPFDLEEVISIPGRDYVSLSFWDAREFEGEALPEGSTPVSRNLRGDFLIVRRGSAYNRDPSTYDGRHSKMGLEEFKRYMMRNAVRRIPDSNNAARRRLLPTNS